MTYSSQGFCVTTFRWLYYVTRKTLFTLNDIDYTLDLNARSCRMLSFFGSINTSFYSLTKYWRRTLLWSSCITQQHKFNDATNLSWLKKKNKRDTREESVSEDFHVGKKIQFFHLLDYIFTLAQRSPLQLLTEANVVLLRPDVWHLLSCQNVEFFDH